MVSIIQEMQYRMIALVNIISMNHKYYQLKHPLKYQNYKIRHKKLLKEKEITLNALSNNCGLFNLSIKAKLRSLALIVACFLFKSVKSNI